MIINYKLIIDQVNVCWKCIHDFKVSLGFLYGPVCLKIIIIIIFCLGVYVVFLILAAGNISSLVHLHVHGDIGKTGELRIWLVICYAVLLPCSWLGTPKEFWGIAVGASLATAVACLMICVCIGLNLPADLKAV